MGAMRRGPYPRVQSRCWTGAGSKAEPPTAPEGPKVVGSNPQVDADDWKHASSCAGSLELPPSRRRLSFKRSVTLHPLSVAVRVLESLQ